LTVRIHHLTQAAHDEVLGKLCVAINETQTVFPGTDLTLIFKIGSSEIPPDQSSEGVVHQSLTSAGHQCEFFFSIMRRIYCARSFEFNLLDRADFDAVVEAAAARNRWEFMLTIAPLAIPHGTGSPVNPIAMF